MNNTLSHKGYLGSIECDLVDSCLHGRVLYVNDVITYQGETIPELQRCFREALDGYLETCAEIGKLPDKPFSGTLNIRIKSEIHRRLAYKAAECGSTINSLIGEAIDQMLNGTVTHSHVHVHTYTAATDLTRTPGFSESSYPRSSTILQFDVERVSRRSH